MAAKKDAPAAPAKPTAAVVVEPPKSSRARQSTTSPELIADMVAKIEDGFVSDGLDYASKKDASNASVVHRRALIRAMDGDPTDTDNAVTKRITGRTWELTGDDGKPNGRWVFALGVRKQDDTATDDQASS